MAEQVTPEQFPGYKRMFDRFDTSGNGFLSSSEWGDVLKKMGESSDEAEVNRQIQEVDADHDGKLNFSDFVHMMGRRMKKNMEKSDNPQLYKFAFEIYDKDNSGSISHSEMRLLMTIFGEKITDDEIVDMLSAADTTLDGKITSEEFVEMMKKKYNK